MKLRNLGLSIYGHPNELSVPFSFETRSLCNFVQRHARSLKIGTTDFNQIVVCDDPYRKEIAEPKVAPVKTLVVPFQFDRDSYLGASPTAKQDYFIEILSTGLTRAHEFHPLPIEDLLAKIAEFKTNGYRNCWVHRSKAIRSAGLTAELQCELTASEFFLTLEVRDKKGALSRIPLLSTKPDETCFHYKFDDILVREDDLVVTKRKPFDGELARFPLSSFAPP
jgi:hypothetical protein